MMRAKEMKPGMTDLGICHRGQFIAIELKIKPNGLSKKQRGIHRELMIAGAVVHTCWSLREVHDFLALIVPLVHDV